MIRSVAGLLVGLSALLSSLPASADSRVCPEYLSAGALADCLAGHVECGDGPQTGECAPAGSYELAALKASECDTPTSWAEQVAPGVWVAVCGSQEGEGPVNSCIMSATLHWHMSGGRDSEYENVLAACEAEHPYFAEELSGEAKAERDLEVVR